VLPHSVADTAPPFKNDCLLVGSCVIQYGEQARQRKLGTSVDQSIERRNSLRFQIALSLLLRWTDGANHYDTGHCVNIGQGGMFVLASRTPLVGVEVEVEFVLPAFGGVTRPTRLHCVGRVSRVEMCHQLKGFAIAGLFVNELRGEQATCESVGELL